MAEKPVKTEEGTDLKTTLCCSPLNLKLSPNHSYQEDDLKVKSPRFDAEEAIRIHLEAVFLTPEANLVTLEDKARSLRHLYGTLNLSDKVICFRMLYTSFGVDHHLVERLAGQVASSAMSQSHRSDDRMVRIEDRLRSALVPRYQQLFTVLSRLDNGIRFLLQLRSDVISILNSPGVNQDCAQLQTINSVLHNLLSIWLSVGSLRLEKVTWESPCDLLQKICAYEAVQTIRNWVDLKQRVGPYRRCFAFTHITLPREPVIVVHTAITNQISWNIQTILENLQMPNGSTDVASPLEVSAENMATMTTAVFYSITSTQKGLQGIELGNHLIKRIITELQAEFPRMHHFSSLSPIPGFRDWFLDKLNLQIRLHEIGEDHSQVFLSSQEFVDLVSALGSSESSVLSALREMLLTNSWIERPHWYPVLKGILLNQCARYLYNTKKRGYVLNPVANFHLRNGAVLWRLNWMADMSSRGVSAAFGLMANYRYYPEEMELNSKNYIERRTVVVSDQIMELIHSTRTSTDHNR